MSKFFQTDLETNHYETTTGSTYGWKYAQVPSSPNANGPTQVGFTDAPLNVSIPNTSNIDNPKASGNNDFCTAQNQNASSEISQKMEETLPNPPQKNGEPCTRSTTQLQTNVHYPIINGEVLRHHEVSVNDLGANTNVDLNTSDYDPGINMLSFHLADDVTTNPNNTHGISNITQELANKISGNINEQVEVFFHQFNTNQQSLNGVDVTKHDARWDDPMYVRTVFSTRNTLINHKGSFIKWDKIKQSLLDLVKHCTKGAFPGNVDMLMGNALSRYGGTQGKTDFMTLTHPDIKTCLPSTIPTIVQNALSLPSLLAEPVPFLKAYESKTIYMTKRLIGSLLANAFFCTIPQENENMPGINFHRMFNTATRGNAKVEKLKCILNYFQQLRAPEQNPERDDQIISFERRVIHDRIDWARSKNKLTNLKVEPTKRIEEAYGCLQVDFANKRVGGGILNEGAVMEEIMFAICPELIISRLFTEPLKDEEVLIITGAEQYSKYGGYGGSFHYTGPTKGLKYEVDNLGRICTQIVVMDALNFKQYELETQFEKRNIDRELHKAFVGFVIPIGEPNIPIATGNWGCGAFNGDVELKFLIQWIAATEAGRNLMIYHCIGDTMQSQAIKSMEGFLTSKSVNIGELYNAIVGFHKRMSRYSSLFDYLKNTFANK